MCPCNSGCCGCPDPLYWKVILSLRLSMWLSLVQSLSHVQLFVTPWTAACQASLSITNSQRLLKLMSIESVMPSNHLILSHPLFLPPSIFPSIKVFSNESVLHIRWPKYWSFSFSIRASNEYSGLISFRMNWLDLTAVQGTLKSLLQNHSSKNQLVSAGDVSSILGLERGRRKWQPIPVFLLENPMDRGDWQAIVHGISRVRHSWTTEHACFCPSAVLRAGCLKFTATAFPRELPSDQLNVPSLEGYDPFPWWADLNQWVTGKGKAQSSGSRWVTLWCSPSFHLSDISFQSRSHTCLAFFPTP